MELRVVAAMLEINRGNKKKARCVIVRSWLIICIGIVFVCIVFVLYWLCLVGREECLSQNEETKD